MSKSLKPTKFKHFAYGHSKYANMLLARIRIGYSYLKAHSYSTGHSDTMHCTYCNSEKPETSKHFIIACPYFTEMRLKLFDQIEQGFIPNFKRLTMQRQYDILIYGYEPQNPEMKKINGKIMTLTQSFILKTKRFKPEP